MRSRSAIATSLFLFPLLVSSTLAQSTFDAADYQPVRATVQGVKELFLGLGDVVTNPGDSIEVDLPVDEIGRPVILDDIDWGAAGSADLEFLIRSDVSPQFFSLGTIRVHGFGGLNLPSPIRVGTLRIVHIATNQAPFKIFDLDVNARRSPRHIEIEAHPWFLSTPTPRTLTSTSVRIYPEATDNFGILFLNYGHPLLSAPIQVSLTSRGGMLLDPATSLMVDMRPLLGTPFWQVNDTFLFNPALLGMEVHLQAVLGDFFSYPGYPILYWTRPLTYYP